MPVPVYGEPEWVELYNTDSNAVFKIDHMFIADSRNKVSIPSCTISKGEYCILTRDTTALKLKRNIPNHITLIQLSLPSLNNTVDNIVISDSFQVYDSLSYSLKDGKKGISFERIVSFLDPTKDNYGICINIDSATCGYINSISPIKQDLILDYVSILYDSIVIGYYNPITSNIMDIVCLLECNDAKYQFEFEDLAFNEKKIVKIPLSSVALKDGWNTLCFTLTHKVEDPRNSNNLKKVKLFHSYPYSEAAFNEIYYSSINNQDPAEFIEIETQSPEQSVHGYSLWIDSNVYMIQQHGFSDTKFKVVYADSSLVHNGNEYNIFTDRSYNLNNTQGFMKLIDPNGKIIDSIEYNNQMHILGTESKNRSLERWYDISTKRYRWTTSASWIGKTPGSANSINAGGSGFEVKIQNDNGNTTVKIISPFTQAFYSSMLFSRNMEFIGYPVQSSYISSIASVSMDKALINYIQSDAYYLYNVINNIENSSKLELVIPCIITK